MFFQIINNNPGWERNTSMARRRKNIYEQLSFLYNTIEQLLLRLLLPVGMVTIDNLSHTLTNLDLVFGMPGIKSQIVKCGTHSVKGVGFNKRSDYFPVKTTLDICWEKQILYQNKTSHCWICQSSSHL